MIPTYLLYKRCTTNSLTLFSETFWLCNGCVALTSRRSFERRVKTRLEQIQVIELNEPNNSRVLLNNSSEENNDENMECDCDVVDENERDISDNENSEGDHSDTDYSDDDFSDEEDFFSADIITDTLEMKLWKWAIRHFISLTALSELLKFLPPHLNSYNNTLPKDARTLLRTPKTVIIEEVPTGKFWHSGLLENLLLMCHHLKCPDTVKLNISVDGTKPEKSSVEEFWPIQCDVNGVDMKPFFVRVWLGEGNL